RDRFPAVQDPSRRLSRSSDPRTMVTLAPSRRPLGAAHDANSREVIAPPPTPASIPAPTHAAFEPATAMRALTSDLAMTCVAILKAFGPPRTLAPPRILVLVPRHVAGHQSALEGLRVERAPFGGALARAVDVLPPTAVRGELAGQGRRQRDVVPAL